GPLELTDKLPGIDREAFDILPLPLCKQGVKCQTALTRATGPRDDDQLAARDVEIDVFEVVGAGAADLDAVGGRLFGFTVDTGAHAAHLSKAKTCYCSRSLSFDDDDPPMTAPDNNTARPSAWRETLGHVIGPVV